MKILISYDVSYDGLARSQALYEASCALWWSFSMTSDSSDPVTQHLIDEWMSDLDAWIDRINIMKKYLYSIVEPAPKIVGGAIDDAEEAELKWIDAFKII